MRTGTGKFYALLWSWVEPRDVEIAMFFEGAPVSIGGTIEVCPMINSCLLWISPHHGRSDCKLCGPLYLRRKTGSTNQTKPSSDPLLYPNSKRWFRRQPHVSSQSTSLNPHHSNHLLIVYFRRVILRLTIAFIIATCFTMDRSLDEIVSERHVSDPRM